MFGVGDDCQLLLHNSTSPLRLATNTIQCLRALSRHYFHAFPLLRPLHRAGALISMQDRLLLL